MEKRFTSHRLRAAKAQEGPEQTPDTSHAETPVKASATSAIPPVPQAKPKGPTEPRPKEIGGPSGPEPTRYGDWERNGICYDF